MKKVFLSLTAAILFSIPSFAQLDISLMAGVNSTDFRCNPDEYLILNDWGYQGGVHVRIGKKTFFETGVQWLQSKTEFQSTVDNIIYSDIISVSQLRIPAYLGKRIIKLGIVDLRVNTGPTMRIVSEVLDNDYHIHKEYFNEAVWSWDFGAGLDILVFSLDVNYELGLSEMISGVSGTQNDILNITLGLTF
ncbi:MAG: hypothetical protein C0593_03365 [Marinilabiliales bacterium]|nr:MAG: hypothetical protein C0593_03365 [Marinilabiliales bacterium]